MQNGGGDVWTSIVIFLGSVEYFHPLTEISHSWTSSLYKCKPYWQYCHRSLLPSTSHFPLSAATSTRQDFLQLIRMLRNPLLAVPPTLPSLRNTPSWPGTKGVITFSIDILCGGKPVLDFTFCLLVDKDGNLVDNYTQATENGLEPWVGRKSVVGKDGDMLTNVNQKEWYRDRECGDTWTATVVDTTKRINGYRSWLDGTSVEKVDTGSVNPSMIYAMHLMKENQRKGCCHCKSVGIDESSFLKDLRDRSATVQAACVGAMDGEVGWAEDGSFHSAKCHCPLHLVMSFHIEMEGGSGTGDKKRARQTAELRKPVILLNEPRPFWVESSATDGVDVELEWRTDVTHGWSSLDNTWDFGDGDATSDLGTDQNARYGSRELLFDPSFELILSPEGQSGEVANVTKVFKDDFVLDAALNFKRGEEELAWKEESFTWKEHVLPGLLELWNAD